MEVGKDFYTFCLDCYIFSGIWAWYVDAIVEELGSFTLIGFFDGSLLWTISVRAYRQCPVNPESAIGSFVCGCGGDIVLVLGRV